MDYIKLPIDKVHNICYNKVEKGRKTSEKDDANV